MVISIVPPVDVDIDLMMMMMVVVDDNDGLKTMSLIIQL